MFVAQTDASLRRGKRIAPRTEVCRPCLVWQESVADIRIQGVVLDLNPYGFRIRMLEEFEAGTHLIVQMMRDDEFRVPLSPPLEVPVMRIGRAVGGFVDHGIKIIRKKIKKPQEFKRVEVRQPSSARRNPIRMHTAEETLEEFERRRTGRNRG